jgi:hypothetical protein
MVRLGPDLALDSGRTGYAEVELRTEISNILFADYTP